MAERGYDPLELLEHIDPAGLDYTDWLCVGMALKDAGIDASVFEDWCKRDPARYKPGEARKKYNSMRGSATPVTVGTLYEYARRQGWSPSWGGHVIGWNDVISDDGDLRVIDPAWIGPHDGLPNAPEGNGAAELREYLELLFRPEEYVGYTVESSYDEEKDKFHPSGSGYYTRTAGELIDLIDKYKDREDALNWVLGDYDPLAGAWIRFNPLDGKGVHDENVSSYRYALVESDAVSIEQQFSLIQALELPVAVLIHSGKKSLHAIVRVDAKSLAEYREKVKYLYEVCDQNGLTVDQNNKNPSRLSRMPGVVRGDERQYIVARNLGKPTYQDWVDYIEDLRDELPEDEDGREDVLERPALAPELIQGILRQGHKMLLSGPSKAGKSFALIELATAINEGGYWFGHKCRKGAVYYVNLEVDRPSFIGRLIDVREALHKDPAPESGMLRLWNLRGEALPLDKLAPKLIRRIKDQQYLAVIIDPIYKVLTGDENSASEMAAFCNEFDRICRSVGASVIYCHHHSKGQQSGKAAMDRASGSGVFARDPDALVDFLPMKVPPNNQMPGATAWKVSYTLREFPSPEPEYYWFKWPIHVADECGDIARGIDDTGDAKPDKVTIKSARLMQFDIVYQDLLEKLNRCVSLDDMAAALQPDNNGQPCQAQTVRKYIQSDLKGQYKVEKGLVFRV